MVVLAKMEPAGLLLHDAHGVSVAVLILISCFLGTSSLEANFFFPSALLPSCPIFIMKLSFMSAS